MEDKHMSPNLGGISFDSTCIYRGRKDLDSTEDSDWICTIQPGKDCSEANCHLDEFPFKENSTQSEPISLAP